MYDLEGAGYSASQNTPDVRAYCIRRYFLWVANPVIGYFLINFCISS